jgi:hypothetical protein
MNLFWRLASTIHNDLSKEDNSNEHKVTFKSRVSYNKKMTQSYEENKDVKSVRSKRWQENDTQLTFDEEKFIP